MDELLKVILPAILLQQEGNDVGTEDGTLHVNRRGMADSGYGAERLAQHV